MKRRRIDWRRIWRMEDLSLLLLAISVSCLFFLLVTSYVDRANLRRDLAEVQEECRGIVEQCQDLMEQCRAEMVCQ